MNGTGYRTSARCTLLVDERGKSLELPGRLVDISNDGAQVLCERPLPTGAGVRLLVNGLSNRDIPARIIVNHGDGGDGYRLSIRLTEGSWPYSLFVALTTLGCGDRKQPAPTPPCLAELGLTMPCSSEQVEGAFSSRVRKVHPDRGGNIESFVRLRAAYLESLALLGRSR